MRIAAQVLSTLLFAVWLCLGVGWMTFDDGLESPADAQSEGELDEEAGDGPVEPRAHATADLGGCDRRIPRDSAAPLPTRGRRSETTHAHRDHEDDPDRPPEWTRVV